jgi:hypothetical protein
VQSYGITDPIAAFARPPPLQLKPGDVRRDVDFALERAYAVEGRVQDEFGEPLASLQVTAERLDARGGSTRTFTSDDRGAFRVYGLAPGRWRVCASADGGFGGMPWDRPTVGDSTQTRFVKTCVPHEGATAAAGLPIVEADVAGVQIQMQRASAYTLSGRLVAESGAPVQQAMFLLQRRSQGAPYFSSQSLDVRFDKGTFTARGLTPGDYVLRATVEDPPEGRAFGEFPMARLMALVPIAIEASDVTGLVLVARRGADVKGRIVFDAEGPFPSAAERPAVVTRREADPDSIYYSVPTPRAQVKEDWTFELSRVHGPVLIAVNPLPDGWIVGSVRYGLSDVTDLATDFLELAPRTLEVRVTNRVARVTPIVLDAAGEPVTAAIVMLVPADPVRWKAAVPLSNRTMVPMSSRPGAQRAACRPGDYIIAAISPGDLRGPLDIQVIRRLVAGGRSITLKAGDDIRIDVPLVSLSEGRLP